MGMHMTGSDGILTVPSEHLPGLVALVAFPLVAWFAVAAIRAGSSRGNAPAVRLQQRLDATPFVGRVALVAMLVGAAVHAAIIPTHWGDSRVLAILFVLDTLGFLAASAWLFLGRPHWRLLAFGMLAGTFVGYAFYLLKGWETPDPVGLVTTGIELAGALVLAMPERVPGAAPVGRRWALAAAAPIALVTMLGTAALAGVPAGDASPAGAASTSHHPMPGMSTKGTADPSTGSSSMPGMTSGTSSGSSGADMPSMTGTSSGTDGGSGTTMPGMPAPSGGSTTTMPGMGAGSGGSTSTTMPGMTGGSGGTTSTTMPGMGGGSGGGSLSLATTSPAGPVVWPTVMGSMGPGMQMVTPDCTTEPTAVQQQASVALVDQTVAGTTRYQSLANAVADGYVPITPPGQPVVHYAKPSFINDGQLLDPGAIESLVYANTSHGAVLVAAMYLMAGDQVGATPPMPGGYLTEWHVHTNLCFSTTTGVVVGTDAGGACKAGSVNHVSQPMIHVWLAPVPGGPLVVDASEAQVIQAADQLPAPSPPNASV